MIGIEAVRDALVAVSKAVNSLSTSTVVCLIIVAIGLYNAKVLPLAYHVRIIRAIGPYVLFNRRQIISTKTHGPHVLFHAVGMTSFCPLMEVDFNIHKSNSTFFSDLDINRAQLLAMLFKPALRIGGLGGKLDALLGGTSCIFKKAIAPHQKYEVWSRVLTWDDKWLYMVSHFVNCGRVDPHPTEGRRESEVDRTGNGDPALAEAVLASSISRYVLKDGRRTVSPESVLRQLQLIPSSDESGPWDEARALKERDEGLELARGFTALDGLQDRLHGDAWPILAKS